jgi:hypothetical protein
MDAATAIAQDTPLHGYPSVATTGEDQDVVTPLLGVSLTGDMEHRGCDRHGPPHGCESQFRILNRFPHPYDL